MHAARFGAASLWALGFFFSIASFAEEAPTPPLRTDIREAVRLGVHALTNAFDRDADDEPYFNADRRPDGTGFFAHAEAIGVPHVVGRCLLGCGAAERIVGVPFPPKARAILTRYCKSSFDDVNDLNTYIDKEHGGGRKAVLHNLREGLYSLNALIEAGGEDGDWARSKAAAMLRTVESFTSPDGRLSHEMAARSGLGERVLGFGNDATTSGRFVDALLDYHKLTKDPLAWKLAGLYVPAALETTFTPEGRFAPMKTSGGHIHSITSTLSGIARYADATDDRKLLDRCARIVDVGVAENFSSWGWGDEVQAEHPANVPSRGEVNQTGDVVRTALVLGARVSPKYYGLAERFIRGSLLPDQVREDDLRRFLKDNPDPRRDAERDVLARSVGGYGFPLPNDHMREGAWTIFTLDITSGAVHALCEAWKARVTRTDHDVRVNLLFDYESDDLKVRSGLPLQGRIEVQFNGNLPVRIRIPDWVDRGGIRLSIGDEVLAETPAIADGYLTLPSLDSGRNAVLTFPVPRTQVDERVDDVLYHVIRLGDQIVEISPRGKVSPIP